MHGDSGEISHSVPFLKWNGIWGKVQKCMGTGQMSCSIHISTHPYESERHVLECSEIHGDSGIMSHSATPPLVWLACLGGSELTAELLFSPPLHQFGHYPCAILHALQPTCCAKSTEGLKRPFGPNTLCTSGRWTGCPRTPPPCIKLQV